MKLKRRGSVAAMSAVVMLGVVGMAGLAIDLTRIWLLSARLKTSVDAAALVAARTIDSPSRDADTRALFLANFTANNAYPDTPAGRYLRSTLVTQNNVTITQLSSTRVRVTARARIGTTLFGIISPSTTDVEETSVAEREGNGLELAIVLDQTASMSQSAGAGMGGITKLRAAQDAVISLLDRLYGTDRNVDTRQNLWISVVPFARTVNIGTANTSFLDVASMPQGWNIANWSGCVEARTNGNDDIIDLGPNDAGGRLTPYFYRNTYRRVGYVLRDGNTTVSTTTANTIVQLPRNATNWTTATRVAAVGTYPGYDVPQYAGANACTTGNAYPGITVNLFASDTAAATTAYTVAFCRGDNDYNHPGGLSTIPGNAAFNPEFRSLVNAGFTGVGNLPTSAAGPNKLCAQSPILPLTASRTTVQNAVNAIVAPPRSGGTTVVTGMQGAWYTLSPRWQGQWPNISSGGALGTLPLAYNTRNMDKAVIILTDGDNNWQPVYCPPGNNLGACASSSVRASATGDELLYNAYGRVADWNATFPGNQIGTVNQTTADARLDGRFAAICAAMKGSNRPIPPGSTAPLPPLMNVYVVAFEARNPTAGNATAVIQMLQNCATQPNAPFFIEVTQPSDLDDAFAQIGNSLLSLRLEE